MKYTKYNPATGEITSVLTITDATSLAVNLSDYYLDGHYDSYQYYVDVDNRVAIAKPEKPSSNHIWNLESRQWVLDTQQIEIDIRNQRNWQLSYIDRINPVWYSTLTTEQQQELVDYRQDLLNVPQQSGFPEIIDWPTKPAWL
jgi:hypothetical protein